MTDGNWFVAGMFAGATITLVGMALWQGILTPGTDWIVASALTVAIAALAGMWLWGVL